MLEALRLVRLTPPRLVKRAPLPVKLPTKLFAAFPNELAPLKMFAPAKVWLALINATLPDRRGGGSVPKERLAALRLVRLAPLPLKLPTKLFAALAKEVTPLNEFDPVKV